MFALAIPPLYKSGVRYRRESPKRERWLRSDEVLEVGYGDCEDLAAWRAAELRQRGLPAKVIVKKTGPRKFHALVAVPTETGRWITEDPSRRLGMGAKRG